MSTAPSPPPTGHHRDERAVEFGRIISFSDGVFAIAVTLLVLSISVPELSEGQLDRLPQEIADLWPQVLSYFISFAVIANLWLAHHRFFGNVERFDGRLVALNLLFLSLVSLLPLPTALLGEYGDQSIVVIIYAVCLVLVGVVKTAMTLYAGRRGLLAPAAQRHVVEMVARGLVVPGVFLASVPIAAFDTSTAQLSWLAIIPVSHLVDRLTAGVEQEDELFA